MNAQAVIEAIREEQPFRPLVFEFTNGHTETVRHPDNVMVFGTYLIIPQYEEGEDVPARPKRYSLMHLVSVEPVALEAN